jgi:hypothetical protein
VRALSVIEPWASLISVGVKHYETRSFSTSFRGLLAIHASRNMPAWAVEFARQDIVTGPLCRAGILPGNLDPWQYNTAACFREHLPLGCIVAVAELVVCVPTIACVAISSQERAFGDYSPGRWAWGFLNIRRLREPISCRGALSLWTVPPNVVEQIRAQGVEVLP